MAAANLFAAQPYAQVQMDEVAQAAGMGKPTLYRYFPSKADLFFAVFEHALEALGLRLDEIASARLEPSERIDAMIRALFEMLTNQIATLRQLEGEGGDMAGRWRGVYRRRRTNLLKQIRTVLAAAQAGGAAKHLDLDAAPAMIMGMVRGGLMGAAGMPLERLISAAQTIIRPVRY